MGFRGGSSFGIYDRFFPPSTLTEKPERVKVKLLKGTPRNDGGPVCPKIGREAKSGISGSGPKSGSDRVVDSGPPPSRSWSEVEF
jgi:hypothetical protein